MFSKTGLDWLTDSEEELSYPGSPGPPAQAQSVLLHLALPVAGVLQPGPAHPEAALPVGVGALELRPGLEVSTGGHRHVPSLVFPLKVTGGAGRRLEPAVLVVLVGATEQGEGVASLYIQTTVRDLDIETVHCEAQKCQEEQ